MNPNLIKKLVGITDEINNDQEDLIVTCMFRTMKEMGLSFEEIKELPLSTFMIMLDEFKKLNKEMESEMEKSKPQMRSRRR